MKFDALAILAGGINKEGILSGDTINRLNKGLELFRKQNFKKVIVSGRFSFLYDYVPTKTEAKAMIEYLSEKGIPKEKLILEDKSRDTIGNAYFVKGILKKNGWKKIIIVTSDFHIDRTKYIFKKVFGKGFKINFVKAGSDLSKEELEKVSKKEMKALNLTKQWLDKIENGNDKQLKDFLYSRHPAYSKKQELTREQILKMLGE